MASAQFVFFRCEPQKMVYIFQADNLEEFGPCKAGVLPAVDIWVGEGGVHKEMSRSCPVILFMVNDGLQ